MLPCRGHARRLDAEHRDVRDRRGTDGTGRSRSIRRRSPRPAGRAGGRCGSSICARASRADHALEIADQLGIGVRAGGGADDVEGVVDVRDPVAQRLVHRVLERAARRWSTGAHFGAEQLHAEHIGLLPLDILARPCRSMQGRPKRAQTVAVATPCWPAPVSAMIRVLPMRIASRIWPMQLLILCAPVWLSSSRLNQICAPLPAGAPSRSASVSRSA